MYAHCTGTAVSYCNFESSILSLKSILNAQDPVYQIVSGVDSSRFIRTGGNQLNMISAAANRSAYTVTIAAYGDSLFANNDSKRPVKAVLIGGYGDTAPRSTTNLLTHYEKDLSLCRSI